MTVPRYWPCSKGSRVASPSAISVIGARHEPPSGPRKRACWFSHGPMPRRKSTCWLRCGKASRPRFPSCGIGFSTVSFHVPGVVCGTRSNSRSFTTISATPASSRNSELKTEVRLLLDLLIHHRDRLRQIRPDTPETRTLQFLVEERRKLVNEKIRLSQRL